MPNAVAEMIKDHECPFMEICEEYYNEPEMIEFRKQCTIENCKKCDHYWGFFEGYCDAMELA